MCLCMSIAWECRCQRRSEVLGLSGAENLAGICEPTNVGSGTQLKSCAGAIFTLNQWAISPATEVPLS